MFKLCIAVAVFWCLANFVEAQTFNRQQAAHLSFYQQQIHNPFYQHKRFQPRPGYYQVYNKKYVNDYYNRPGVEGLARTVIQQNNIRPDGSYEYIYETENGIYGQERNIPKSLRLGESSGNAEGSYAYTSPEGLKVLVDYAANENGFRPVLSYGGNGAAQFINSPNPSSVIVNKQPYSFN